MNAMQLYLACLLATAHGAFLGGLRAPTRTPVRSSARSFVSMDVSKGVVITGGAGGVGYACAVQCGAIPRNAAQNLRRARRPTAGMPTRSWRAATGW